MIINTYLGDSDALYAVGGGNTGHASSVTTILSHNARTMVVDGTHGVGRALDVLSVYDRPGCDVVGLQETRHSGHSAFTQAGYLGYCSGECDVDGGNGPKKGEGGVGLAVRTSITRAARPPEFISDRLLRLHLNYVIEPRLLRFLWRMPRLKHRMLVINMHSGRALAELWRRYLNMNNCSC